MIENVNRNGYWVVTQEGRFYIEAKELETTYDEKQQCDYIIAFDEDGRSIAYFKNVLFWIKSNRCLQADLNGMKGE